jgi:hypothetical protein
MSDEATPAERLVESVTELLRAGAVGTPAARARLAAALADLGSQLRRLSDDPSLGSATKSDDGSAPPLADLLRDVGAALGAPVEGALDADALAARLDALLGDVSGQRAAADDEVQARIRASAERAVAESLRRRGIEPRGSAGQ